MTSVAEDSLAILSRSSLGKVTLRTRDETPNLTGTASPQPELYQLTGGRARRRNPGANEEDLADKKTVEVGAANP